MKIGFITDTNIIKLNSDDINRNVSFLKNTKYYLDYIESLKKLNLHVELVYIMPSIILEELYNQKLSAYNVRYNNFESTYKEISYGLKGNFPKNNYNKVLTEQKKEFYSKFLIIEPDLTSKSFKRTVLDALKKEPPFDKTLYGKKTDSGFKDYMIWKTIESSKLEDFNEIYFFSGDKIFDDNKEQLEKQFNEKNKTTKIYIKYIGSENYNKQNESLDIIISKYKLPKTEVVELYDLELNLRTINSIEYDLEKEFSYYTSDNRENKILKINFETLEKNEISIEDVKNENDEFCVIIKFNTKKYESSIDLEEHEKIGIKGNIKIYYKKNSKNYKLIKYVLENISMDYSLSNLGEMVKLYSNLWHEAIEKSIKELRNALSAENIEKFKKAISSVEIYKDYAEIINDKKIKLINNASDKKEEKE